MNRTQDYVDFALRFCGIGYALLWPLSTPQDSGAVFGASYVCGAAPAALADILCAPRPLLLPLPLHAAGAVAALYAFGMYLLGRRRQRRAPAGPPPLDIGIVAARLPALRIATDAPPPRGKPAPWSPPPRSRPQFGLRMPQTPVA